MRLVIPKEITQGEQRVALVPQLVAALQKQGWTIVMQKGAGSSATYKDEDYVGVEFVQDPSALYGSADVIVKVDAPTQEEIALFKPGSVLIGMLSPSRNVEQIKALKEKGITSFALEFVPRISRAQTMDALSSQATVAGYKAVLMGASLSQRFFPMLTTAAGTIRPASVLIIGAGVAGLQAIATARRLGAMVKAYDVRAAAREQIESLGAKMVQIDVKGESQGGYARELTADEKAMQQAALFDAVKQSDVVICTAQIPGRQAPKIVTKDMVEAMHAGSVIVDIAASTGGNCELTQAGETINHQGVLIAGPTNLASSMARDASSMYAKNIISFLELLIKDKQLAIDWSDPVIAESAVTHEKVIRHPATRELIEGQS
jgi:H+-translocating NAD(P) transhydrogenase subunit alpha